MGGRALLLAMLCAAAGCLQADQTVCGDGRICPATAVCDETHGLCVEPQQLEDCAGRPDGDDCTVGTRAGVCHAEVCLPAGCGDFSANDLEECDGDDLRGATCLDLGYYEEGALACGEDCRYVETGCSRRCNDGVINGDNEVCDGDDLAGKTCADFGFYTETTGLRCSSACTFDTAGCTDHCGDGVVNGDEDCDGTDLGGNDCTDLGYYYDTGPLGCDSRCLFVEDQCEGYCGDGQPDAPAEACDGAPPAGGDQCIDFGFDAGHLGCSAFCTPGFAGCHTLGWLPMLVPVNTWLRDIWGAAPDDLFAVGQQFGTILHYDGVEWSEMVATDEWMIGVWGFASNDVWAVGDNGTILHWDGSTWTPHVSGTNVLLTAVWGSTSNDVWAVGAGSVALHWDGDDWSEVSTPGPADTLYAVWGTGPNDVFAAGDNGAILHYDGTWSQMSSPASNRLEGIWGSASNDVWAVGVGGELLHYDGEDWLTTPSIFGATALTAIWGRAADDVYAGGSQGAMMHYDGRAWSHMDTDSSEWVEAIWGPATSNEVFAVGAGAALAYTGRCWSLPGFPVLNYEEVFAAYYPDVYLVARSIGGGSALHYTGDAILSWGMPGNAYGIWASGPEDVFAVGSGFIQHYDGTAWSAMTLPAQLVGAGFSEVWGSGPADVWAIAGNSIGHYDGTSWTRQATAASAVIGLWGSGPNDVWLVGYLGQVYHWNGSQWSDRSGFTELDMRVIWGLGPDDVYVAGNGGAMYHWNGSDWTAIAVPTNETIADLWGSGSEDIFAVTQVGSLLHFDGIAWAPVRTPHAVSAMTVAGTPSSVYVGGSSYIDRLHRQIPWQCLTGETGCGDDADDDCDGLADLADPDCASAVRLTEVRGGGASPSWIEVGNQAARTANLGGLTVSFRSACDAGVRSRQFGSDAIVKPGARFRMVDARLDVRERERYLGADWCDTSTAGAWAALCSGPCDLDTCANVIDYAAKSGVSAPPSPPACASMSPAPVAVGGAAAGDGISRVAFTGGGAAGVQSDWAVQAASRD